MLSIKNVSMSFNSKNILKNINIEFPTNGFFVITGVSGSGKTTLLNLINGQLKPTEGCILCNDVDITKLKKEELINFQNRNISNIFQDNTILNNLSVMDNINLVRSSSIDLNQILKQVRIEKLKHRKVGKLSSGELQKVKIAIALAKSTNVLLCDEPLVHLDKASNLEILQILKDISKTKLVLFVTHDIDSIKEISDDILFIHSGTIDERKEKNQSLFIEKRDKILIDKLVLFKLIIYHFSSNKLRVICTIVIGVLTFLFLAFFFSVQSIDNIERNTLQHEPEKKVYIEKNDLYEDDYYIDNSTFSKNELEEVENVIKDFSILRKGYYYYDGNDLLKFEILANKNTAYYNYDLGLFKFFESDESFKLVVGDYPKAENEIIISSYLADYIMNSQVRTTEGMKSIQSYKELLTSEFYFGNIILEISGIYYQPLEKYEILKEIQNNLQDNSLNYLVKDFADVILLNASNIYVNKKFDNYLSLYSHDIRKELMKLYIIADNKNVENILEVFPVKEALYTRKSSYTNRIDEKVGGFISNYIFIIIFTILSVVSLFIIILNYIRSTKEINQKEIKALKNLGIGNIVIQKMYFLEVLIILLISFLIGIVFGNFIVNQINAQLSIQLMFHVEFFCFNILEMIILLLILLIFLNIYIKKWIDYNKLDKKEKEIIKC